MEFRGVRQRAMRGELLIGIHAVEAALEHDAVHVLELYLESGVHNPRLKRIADRARELGLTPHARERIALDRMTGGARHQGAVARWEAPPPLPDSTLPERAAAAGRDALFLVLDGVTDPHNLGACLRSALAAGVTAVVVPKDRAVALTPTVRRAAAGAADQVPVVVATNLARSLRALKDAGVWLTGLDATAQRPLYAIDLTGPTAIVLGGEGEGLRRLTREHCDHVASIPMAGGAESLNVSVTAGIALFEARRQRGAAVR